MVVFQGVGPTCPLAAVKAWLAAANIQNGPVFVGVDRYGNARLGKRLTDQVRA